MDLFWKLMLISVIIVAIAMAGLGIRMLFMKNAQFSGGSCKTAPGLADKGIGCGCGGGSCATTED